MPIIDIRQKEFAPALAEEIWKGLDQSNGKEKTLPTMLLYDEHGLKLFEEITYLDEYYLTNTEMAILEQHASAIADRIKPNSKLVELGSGYVSFAECSVGSLLLFPNRVLKFVFLPGACKQCIVRCR